MSAAQSQAEILEGLREQIRRLERRSGRSTGAATSGWSEIDAILPGGGFPRGALTELTGGCASGKTALALRALAAAQGEDALAGFVDGRGELYPPAAAALGVALDRLLIVRPEAEGHEALPRALWAAEALLASGAFAAVAIDVGWDVRTRARVTDAMLRRLQSAAEKGGAAGLWLESPGFPGRVPAALRLEVLSAASGAAPRVRRVFSRDAVPRRGGRGGHAA